MTKLTAEDFDRHLQKVVSPEILGQITAENRQIALEGINKALGQQAQTEHGSSHSR